MTLDALMWWVSFRRVGDVWTPSTHHLHVSEKSVIKTIKNIEVCLIYLYIFHLINTRNKERTKIVNSKLECWSLFLARQF